MLSNYLIAFAIGFVIVITLSFVVASEVGSKRQIGRKWSLILCLLTPFLLGLFLTLISPKGKYEELYYKREKGSAERIAGFSCVVIAILLCFLWFNYGVLPLGFVMCISTIILMVYVFNWDILTGDAKEISFTCIVQFILLLCFIICLGFTVKHYVFE